jgi:hypothetical protein
MFLGLATCGDWHPWSFCALVKGGEVRVVGQDIDRAKSPWAPVFEAGLRLALQQRFGRHLYVAARAEGLVNVTRWSVSLDDVSVWTAPRYAATVGLDIGVRFPHDSPPQAATAPVAGGRDD